MKTIILTLLLAITVSANCPLTGKFGVRPAPAVITGDYYDQITALPTMIERKNFFATLSPDEKSRVWLRHFDNVLATYKLDFEQRSSIMAMKGLASPMFYGKTPPEPEQLAKLRAKFDKAMGRAIFDTLGEPEVVTSMTPLCTPCDCRPSVSWCDDCVVPLSPALACQHTSGGCGPAWLWDCTGCCADEIIIDRPEQQRPSK